MDEKVYLIGEFASINKVSARMLRHYDKIGLLKPITVNENGYRIYNESQIAIISKIKILRDCDFSLEDIAQTLMRSDDVFFTDLVKNKILDINNQSKQHQKAIEMLKSFVESENVDNFTNIYGISLHKKAEQKLLVSTQEINLEEIEKSFEALFTFIEKNYFSTNGCAVLLNNLNGDDDIKNQVGVLMLKSYQDDKYNTIIIPKATCLSTIHYGDYYNIGYAYSSIISFAKLNGYTIETLFIERYLIDSSQTINTNEYVTEISVAIKNTP